MSSAVPSSPPASAHAHGPRRRLRRHRHQPALRDARVLLRLARASPPTHENVLGVLSLIIWSLLARHLGQVHRLRHARRQPGRGRHPGADGAGARSDRGTRRAGRRVLVLLGHLRRGAALRRRHDHAGHLGARRRRGPGGRDAAVRALRRADHASSSWSGSSRSSGTARAGVGAAVRPGHGGLVRRDRRRSASAGSLREPDVLAAVDPRHAVRVLRASTAGTASPCSARCSWWSPAARRSTPTWGTSASGRSASPGSRWCCRRCCSTTSARARCC